jgi:glycosyltransferase involved in cell wall biosynthesis
VRSLKVEDHPYGTEYKNSRNYLVVTPAKNEMKMLPDLINDIVNQSTKPVIWVIVDDGSSDKTWSIIKNIEKEFSWVRGIRLGSRQGAGYAHEQYKKVVRNGVEYAIDYCNKHNLIYQFIGIVDADIHLERRYFEKIINVFYTNPKVGVASGYMYNLITKEKESDSDTSLNSSTEIKCIAGGALVFRKSCYETIGGFQDHVPSLIKAHLRNWGIEECPTAIAFHRRKSWSRENYLYSAGNFMYYLNYHPVNAFLTAIYDFFMISPSGGLSYLVGYFAGIISHQRQIDDDELREYYWNSINRLIRWLVKDHK